MELRVISYPKMFDGEAEILTEILTCFNITLHLRKPEATDSEYVKLLADIPINLHPKIILHGAYELSQNYHLKGLHFSTVLRAMSKKYPNVYKSTSCHSLDEARLVMNDFQSIFLSPVFPSISKKGYVSDWDMNQVENFLKENPSNCKVLALGGIDVENLSQVEKYGFSGAAVLGAVWGENPADMSKILSNLTNLMP